MVEYQQIKTALKHPTNIHMRRPAGKIIGAILTATVVSLGFLRLAGAETMSSANYKIQNDVLNMAGGNSSSTNFNANDALGDLATGEDQSSANFQACSGFECFQNTPFISVSVKEGTSAPGTDGAGVALGTLSASSVTTSDGSAVNSIFVTADSNAQSGTVVTVADENGGLKRTSTIDTIASATATLVPGTAGYGLCIFSTSQDSDSPTTFDPLSPFTGGSCDKTTGHDVGAISTTPTTILQSTGPLKGGTAEILTKAAIGTTTASGTDYADTITFVATGPF
jgi:hypothetical protein